MRAVELRDLLAVISKDRKIFAVGNTFVNSFFSFLAACLVWSHLYDKLVTAAVVGSTVNCRQDKENSFKRLLSLASVRPGSAEYNTAHL